MSGHVLTTADTRKGHLRGYLKRELRGNRDGLRELLLDPPEAIHHITVVELIAYGRYRHMRAPAMEKIGKDAIADGVNLLVTLGRASMRTRLWAAEHGVWQMLNHKPHKVVLPQ